MRAQCVDLWLDRSGRSSEPEILALLSFHNTPPRERKGGSTLAVAFYSVGYFTPLLGSLLCTSFASSGRTRAAAGCATPRRCARCPRTRSRDRPQPARPSGAGRRLPRSDAPAGARARALASHAAPGWGRSAWGARKAVVRDGHVPDQVRLQGVRLAAARRAHAPAGAG